MTEEEVRIGKRAVETGGVRVTTRIEEVPVNEQVTLHEERVEVERRPADRPATEIDLAEIREGELDVRTRREEAVVDKQARVVEEVVIGKDVQERTETVQDTVRRTEVHVEEVPPTTRSSGQVETTRSQPDRGTGSAMGSVPRSGDANVTGSDEGAIERGLSRAENAAERATGLDLDRDHDVGQRDPRDNI